MESEQNVRREALYEAIKLGGSGKIVVANARLFLEFLQEKEGEGEPERVTLGQEPESEHALIGSNPQQRYPQGE